MKFDTNEIAETIEELYLIKKNEGTVPTILGREVTLMFLRVVTNS